MHKIAKRYARGVRRWFDSAIGSFVSQVGFDDSLTTPDKLMNSIVCFSSIMSDQRVWEDHSD